MERFSVRIVALGVSAASTSTSALKVVSSSSRNLPLISDLLVSFCRRDPFNGELEVEV